MRGLVILEGPDACGKTTLAEKMVELWGGKYIHLTYVKGRKAMFETQLKALMEAVAELEKGNFVVIDRHWVSENIYADVYRGGSELAAEARIMDRIIMSLGGIYVLCCPMDVELAVQWHKEMHKTGRELYSPSEEIREIAERYKRLWTGKKKLVEWNMSYAAQQSQLSGRQFMENWRIYSRDNWSSKKGPEVFCSTLFGKLEHTEKYFDKFHVGPFNGNFLGNPFSNVLFVGNSLGKGMPGCNWPFHWLSGSSKVMADVLHEIGFDESQGAWVNANSKTKPYLDEVLKFRKWRKIICLGTEAEKQVFKNLQGGHCRYDDWYTVVHPAYAKRFACKGELAKFKNQLKEILK